jgi:hypothetical protein
MRKILIPTDFTIESLQLVEYALLNFPNTKLDIILIAGFKLPDTRWAIFHFSEREQIREQISEEFNATKRRIVFEHKKAIENITIQLFSGINSFAFQDFLEQLHVDDAIIPKGGSLYNPNRKWFDTTGFIKKNVKNVIEVPFEFTERVPQKGYSFVRLFNL